VLEQSRVRPSAERAARKRRPGDAGRRASDAGGVQNGFLDSVDFKIALDDRIGQSHHGKGCQMQPGGGEEKRLADMAGLDERSPVGS
jgi:hypothetical protein